MTPEKSTYKKWLAVLGTAAILLIALILLIFMRPKTDLHLNEVYDCLLKTSVYSQGMQELDFSELETRWGVSSSGFSEGKAFVATDGTSRKILLLHAVDKKSADKAASVLSLYCQDLIDRYDTDNPEEAARVKTYQIRRTRNYVFLLIGDGTTEAGSALESYFDKIRYDTKQ